MKREILFRGKRIDNGEWIYGGIYVDNAECFIINDLLPVNPLRAVCNGVQVDPETVGQFSGELDRNRQRVFEGDVIRIGNEREYYEVRFLHGCFRAFDGDKQVGILGELQHCYIEVIRTIHDKLELPV